MITEKIKILKGNTRRNEFEVNGLPAGLARSHKIQRAQQLKELQFIQICKYIEAHEKKRTRSAQQRNDRISKRRSSR